MSLQVTGGQWAPHGPTPSPLAPCVSLSVHTHKETTLAQGHIYNVFLEQENLESSYRHVCPVQRMLMSTVDIRDVVFCGEVFPTALDNLPILI